MNATAEIFAGERMPYYMSPADGMNEEYLHYARKLCTMLFQSLCSTQLEAIEAPAYKEWADYENRELMRDGARYANIAAEMVELIMGDLGLDAEALRKEAEASLDGGKKLRMVATPILSWNDGLMQRFLYSQVMLAQLPSMVSSNYIRLANIAQKLLMDHCMVEWPQKVGSRYYASLKRAVAEDGTEELQQALERWWPIACDSFGRPNSENDQTYNRLGLKNRANTPCRELFLDNTTRLLQDLGLTVPTA